MEVVAYQPIGYQVVTNPGGDRHIQLRYCCTVRPLGEFVRDPALHERGGIDAIQLIDPAGYRRYVDWGGVGDRLMSRALGCGLNLAVA